MPNRIKLDINKEDFKKKLDLKDGKDGYTPIKNVDYFDGKDGEKGDVGESGSPDTPEMIVEKLHTKFNVLDFRVLTNIPDFILAKDMSGNQGGGGGSIIGFKDSTGVTISQYVNSLQFGTGITPTYANGTITLVSSAGTSIGGTITGGTAGSVLFVNPTGIIAQDNANFNYTGSALNIGVSILQNSAYARFGNALPFVAIITGVDVAGNDNTLNGVQIGSTNRSAGTSAFNGYSFNNDLASDGLIDHYCFIGQNSSTYTDVTFGTLFASANQMQVQNTDGDIVIVASAVGKQVHVATGGNSTSNKRVSVGDSNISTTVSINGVSVASQQAGAFGASFTGSGGVIANGTSTSVTMDYAGTLAKWFLSSISGNAVLSGSCTIAIKKNGTDIIGAGTAPSLSSASSSSGTNFASWTTTFVAGDVFIITINSVTTCQNVSLTMQVTKT